MKKKTWSLILLVIVSCLFFTGCCKHEWEEATCTEAKTCVLCKKTEGEELGHEWEEATCTVPKTCKVCGSTKGEVLEHSVSSQATCTDDAVCTMCGKVIEKALEHDWLEASCTESVTCNRCGEKQGEALGHVWVEANCKKPKSCSVCGDTEGEVGEHKWVEASCVAPKTCSVCDVTEGERTAHQLTYKGLCSVCGTETAKDFATAEIGSVITFGTMEQDGWFTNEEWFISGDAIEWKVLDKENDRILVISNNVFARIDAHEKVNEEGAISWSNSVIREWLQNTFYYDAFSEAERNLILYTEVCDVSGVNVSDKVFCLSKEEVEKYAEVIGEAYTTSYLVNTLMNNQSLKNLNSGASVPWFISSINEYGSPQCAYGSPVTIHGAEHNRCYVRPAMWIQTTKPLEREQKPEDTVDVDFAALSVGDMVSFGEMEQDLNYANGKDPIEWQVVSVKDGKVLLLSKYILDATDWEDHFEWMQNEFYYIAFSEKERQCMEEYPFSFSEDEMNAYLVRSTYDLNFEAPVTAYAAQNGAHPTKGGGNWCLSYARGDEGYGVAANGHLFWASGVHTGIRPAVWIDIESAKVAQGLTSDVDASVSETDVQVRDLIEIGSYEQDNDLTNGKETIVWEVLEIVGNRALVISANGLDVYPYDENNIGLWADCSLRAWINDSFYNEAFSEEEKTRIIETNTSTVEMTEVMDYVFCLTPEEYEYYFPMNCAPTAYAMSKNVYYNADYGRCGWWLRNSDLCYTVNVDGSVAIENKNNIYFAVRPAMWVEIE